MAARSKRSENFSNAEIRCIIEFYKKNDIVLKKTLMCLTDALVTITRKCPIDRVVKNRIRRSEETWRFSIVFFMFSMFLIFF